ncbi:MAG: serine/threonine-protein kinase [Pirellulaceae bacterium]
MADSIYLAVGQSLQSEAQAWYRNLQLLGTGGNAVTFLAVATSGPHRGVLFAVKVFRKLSKPERRKSFLNEIKFLQGCDHPSIMRVFDTGVFYKEHPFFVAEYLPNTLDKVMRTGEASVVAKISFAIQLLSALVYLEKLKPSVVHRDIKPQNIFVKGRSCVLGDFGLLKHVDAATDEDQEVFKESLGVGMPFRYRTPDQVAYLNNEAPLTSKSDVYQLGLVLAELFTGRNPQKSSTDYTAPIELDPLGSIPGSLAGGIANVINRMLIPDVADRDSASKFLDPWEGIFQNAIKQAHALEGRAFW